MRHQVIRLSKKDRLCIATAHGLIELSAGDHRGEVRVRLPDDLTAHRTPQRALDGSDLIAENTDGGIRPLFKVLTPQMNDRGELVGLVSQVVTPLKDIPFRIMTG